MFHTEKASIVDKVSYGALLICAGLLPIALAVGKYAPPIVFSKVFAAGILVFLTCLCFALARIRDQVLMVPRNLTLAAVWLVPIAYLASSLFATGGLMLFGERLHVDSAGFVLVGALALSLAALTLRTEARTLGLFVTMLGSAFVLTVLELVLFLWGRTLAEGGLVLQSFSLIGSLNDLAVFFGLISVFALLSLILLPATLLTRVALWLSLAAAAFFLAVVNLTVLWWIIGAFALACFVYSVSVPYVTASRSTPDVGATAGSLAMLALAALFLFGSDTFTGSLAEHFNVGELDVRPSWGATMDMGKEVYREHALLGSGPGTFMKLWANYMPPEISSTLFWQTDFDFGIGLIPTAALTSGILGALAWVLFLGAFLWYGVRYILFLRSSERVGVAEYLRITSFVSAAYLWAIAIIQVPSPVITLYAFLLTGAFIASLTFGREARAPFTIVFRDNPRIGFLLTLVLTVLFLGSVAGIFSISERFLAERHAAEAMLVGNAGDLDTADREIVRAIELNAADVYYRLASNVTVVRIQRLLAENKPPEEVRAQFEQLLAQAIANATKATELDGGDYQNWVNLGGIYQNIIPLGIEGAADSANAAFARALELRPNTPTVLLAQASIARSRGNNAEARPLVERAISMRNQYTDAIFLLAQIQIEENKVEEAEQSVRAATLFEPNNPVTFFQLGLLRYSLGKFPSAIQALERAVAINDVYANARYFLGLSYWQTKQGAKALAQFEKVRETNPDNAELTSIIENLRANRDPFARSIATSSIEARTGLPVKDTDAEKAMARPDTVNLTP